MTELELLELLFQAAESPFGIKVQTNDAEYLRQKLYPLRKNNPDFSQLSFIISPENMKDLWILRRPST